MLGSGKKSINTRFYREGKGESLIIMYNDKLASKGKTSQENPTKAMKNTGANI